MLAKYVTGFVTPLQASEVRFVVAFAIAGLVALLLRQRICFAGIKRRLLLLYALAFPACVILFTLAIFHSSVALATAAAYGSALISSFVFGKIFFQERVSWQKGAAFLITVIALFIFTKPWDEFVVSLGLLFGVLSGVLQGASNAVQKQLNQAGADHKSLLLLQCLAGALLASFVVTAFGESAVFWPEGNIFLLILYGASSVATVYLFLVGFRYVDVNTGSILVSSQLFFGPALALLFLGEGIGLHLVVGGMMILLAGILANWPSSLARSASSPNTSAKQ